MPHNQPLTLTEITEEWIRAAHESHTNHYRYENHLEIKKQLSQLIKNSQPFQLKLIILESWLCSFCHTLNGCNIDKKDIRKLCSKCRRKRENPLPYLEELGIEFLKDYRADLIIGDIREINLGGK